MSGALIPNAAISSSCLPDLPNRSCTATSSIGTGWRRTTTLLGFADRGGGGAVRPSRVGGRPGGAGAAPAVGAPDLPGWVGMGDRHPHLVGTRARGEGAVGREVGDLAYGREARRDAHH